ncbi:DUF5689 domain-containing protein [Hanstruepera neustonica]|nr:DUF5689 domain-containing protein [Hanstruepera neustonica]
MKTIKNLFVLSVLSLAFVMSSCVSDDDYSLPNISIQEPNIPQDKITTFLAVYQRFEQAQNDGDPTAIIPSDEELYIEGYVISSDQGGNFFEELIIQNKIDDSDSSEDPRLGLRISINVNSLYNTYQIGRKVYVKLTGLTIGESNGVLVIGKGESSQIEQIEATEYSEDCMCLVPFTDIIIRGTEIAEISPKVTTIEGLSEADENTLIQLNDAQFHRSQLGMTFAGEASDEFDGFRTLESCATNNTIPLQTSTFADFKSLQVDQGRGTIQGIYSRDFGDDFSVLVINSRADINFDSDERCDPNVLECGGSIGTAQTIFSQDMESVSNISDLEAQGWEQVLVAGSEQFIIGSFSGNNYAQISGFSSGESVMETWLVTPDINLDGTTDEALTFDLEVAFSNGVILSVLITDNYTGDVTTTEWTEVDVTIPNTPSSGFGGFNNVGDISIDCLEGNVRVAFKYLGSDPSATTRYHIDNLEVTGN